MATITDIRRACDAPNCTGYVTHSVNLESLAAYMAKEVCERDIDWAIRVLKKYAPSDR